MSDLTAVPHGYYAGEDAKHDQLAGLLEREKDLREDLAEAFMGDIGSIIDALEVTHKGIRNAMMSYRLHGPADFTHEVKSILTQCESAGIRPPYMEMARWIVASDRPEDIRDSWRAYMNT